MLTTPMNEQLSPESNPSINRSCDQCRKRKIRCDFKKPQCATCDRRNKVCSYLDPVRKRGPKPKLAKNEHEDTNKLNNSNENENQFDTDNNNLPIPIPIQISYAEDADSNFNDYTNNQTFDFNTGNFSPSESVMSNLSAQHWVVSSNTSPSSSLNLFGSDYSYSNSPSFVPSDYLMQNLDGFDENFLLNNDLMNQTLNSNTNTQIDSLIPSFGNIAIDPTTATSFDPTMSLLGNDPSPISSLTSLETFLLHKYYEIIHPFSPLIQFDYIQPQLHLIESDFSVRFVINCMCAVAAKSEPNDLIMQQYATRFLDLALGSAPFVQDLYCDNFGRGKNLLSIYFQINLDEYMVGCQDTSNLY